MPFAPAPSAAPALPPAPCAAPGAPGEPGAGGSPARPRSGRGVRRALLSLGVLLAGLVAGCGRPVSTLLEEPVKNTPAAGSPTKDLPAEALATFGGGCFWCTEAVFLRLEGVLAVMSGYAGGHDPDPTYEEVCAGTTGHAEVIQLRYDPRRIDFATLLKVHFQTHDPTTLNRQGYDEGTQYRSIVLFHDAEQERLAREAIAQLSALGAYADPVVTEVVPYTTFFAAEEYHRDYFARNPAQGYCRAVVAPKVDKFEKAFGGLLKRSDPGPAPAGAR